MKSEIKKARTLRHNSTDAERAFWQKTRSRQLGHKFYRQFPINPFIADFACPALKLVVEIDGGQHHENPADDSRTAALNKAGYKVLRFWNNEVLGNMDGVLAKLNDEITTRQKENAAPWL